jgi:DUF1680 family protein
VKCALKHLRRCATAVSLLWGGLSTAIAAPLANSPPLTPVPISQVVIQDDFWSPKLRVWREVTIPDCFAKFEEDGALSNFDKIRDGTGGEHGGPPWYDGLIYEMIRGCADFLASERDPVLEARLDGYIERIAAAAAKDPDGYLNTYTQLKEPAHRWGLNGGNDNWQHDVYNAGAMVEAAVHYYRATGKPHLLQVATRLANHMADVMGPPPKQNVVPGHSLGEEALVKLYVLFREQPGLKSQMPVPVDEQRYLQLAQFWIENRGNHEGRKSYGSYGQDHKPVLAQETIEGHAVRATLLCAGLVAAANVNGREDYLSAALRLWENMVQRRRYVTGGLGAVAGHEGFGPDYVLPNNGYLETCAAVGAGFFHHNLNLALADARFADQLERVLFNSVLSGVSLKGNTYFYENPLEGGEDRKRWAWHGCPCCPPMFLKIMGALPGYIYAQGPGALYVNQFIGSRATMTVDGAKVLLTQTSRYPWDGEIKLLVAPERETEFALNVRLPGWCRDPRLQVNGKPLTPSEPVRGYAQLQRKWRRGDVIRLSFPMPVQRLKAHPKVEADKGRVALQRGPLVYCLEAVDNDGHLRNLVIPPEAQLSAQYRRDVLGGVTVIQGPALAVNRVEWHDRLYMPSANVPGVTNTRFTAIPYFANANRQPGEMMVWLAETPALAVPQPPASLDGTQAREAHITVQADQTIGQVSRLLTGACIEDVNHEIYGGIYSQMLFGESFQEPPVSAPPKGFQAFGGSWIVTEGELEGSAGDGPMLASELPAFADGEASVEVRFGDRTPGNAGLIVRLSQPGTGADNFDGYEVSLDPAGQVLRLGRHRHDFQLIRDTPCEVQVGAWIHLAVKLNGPTIEVLVNEHSVIRYEDATGALLSGTVGLRQWQREARYRNLRVQIGSQDQRLVFEPEASESTQAAEVSGMWRRVRSGDAAGVWTLERGHPFAGAQSQRLSFISGQGEVGVENQGLNRWGLHFAGGKPYEGLFWARSEQPVEVWVALESADGRVVLAEKPLRLKPGNWQRLPFSLTPKATESKGRFALKLKQPGSVLLGYAFLQPGAWGRFKNLPVRRDVAEALVDQGITVLRYGGSMVNDPEYRWKKMIGPRDRRPRSRGTWYPYSSNGWGILDFMDLCEAAGFEYIPAFNLDEIPQDMADFIEYAKGPARSEWGTKRAAAAHPKPYALRFIELGNEERVDEKYFQKFKSLAEAIWAKDPTIILVVGDFLYSQPIQDPFNFRGAASGITSLAGQQRILQLARQHDREVWFDLHVGTEGPEPDSSLAGMISFRDALAKLADGARFRVVVFEFNAGNHSQKRALANALAIQAIERDGRIPITTSANCLQPDGQNDNGWDQGLLFLNPSQVWLQPPGYVARMLSRNYLPHLVKCQVSVGSSQLDANAKRSMDGKTLVLQVVNPSEQEVVAQIHLAGFVPRNPQAEVTELSGPLAAINTAENPGTLVPKHGKWSPGMKAGNANRAFPPYSFTVLRFE